MSDGVILRRNVRTISGSSLTTSYQAIGVPLTILAFKLAIVNNTTTDVNITDGTESDDYYIPANSTLTVGEGLSNFGLYQDRQGSEDKNIQLKAKLVSGVAGTGTLVITAFG